MFWIIVLGLTLPGQTSPIPVMVPPAVAFIAEPQCEAAVKAIQAQTRAESLACAKVSVISTKAESF